MPSLVEIGPVVSEKNFFLNLNFVNAFFLIGIYLPFEKGGAVYLNKLKFSNHQRMHCAKFGWNWPSGSAEEDFKILLMYFRYFIIISAGKGAGPFIWTKLNLLHPKMLFANFGWNWPSGSGENIFKLCQCIFAISSIISPWKRTWLFIWMNLKSFIQVCFVQSL